MNIVDRAQKQEQATRDDALDLARANAAALMVPSGATHCERCGDSIPGGRLQVIPAARHCTPCAAIEGAP